MVDPFAAGSDLAACGQELLHVHAIGSRGFGTSFDVSRHFADSVVFHNYEPDPDANEQTALFFAEHGLAGRAHPIAVFDRDAAVGLNVNHDPYTSSVFAPNPAYRDFYFPYKPPAGDYVFGVATTPYRRQEVPALRLDRLSADAGTPVDWIAMDTQGAEYEILTGAEESCATTLVGFSAEVEFHPLYEGQKLFGDIAALAARHGFHLAHLTPHPAGSFRRAGFGWRGEGLTVAGDALFLRSVTAVRDTHPDPALGLRKLAFASLCHGNIEHALDALLATADIPPPAGSAPSWLRFLDRVMALYRQETPIFPVAFTDVYSLEESLARFAPGCRDQNDDPDRTARRFFSHTDPDRFARALPMLLSSRRTPFEALLADHGFAGVSDTVRRKRQAAAFDSCSALGWFSRPCGPLAEAGKSIGRQLATAGPVCFYGTGEMFAIAHTLLGLPEAAIGGLFDGNPAQVGKMVRGSLVRSPDAVAELPASSHIVLGTRSSEAAMCRTLINNGFRGRVIAFDELLDRLCTAALDGCDVEEPQ